MKSRRVLVPIALVASLAASQSALAMPQCLPQGTTTFVGDCGVRGGCEKHVVILNYYNGAGNPSNWSNSTAVYRPTTGGWVFSEWRNFTWCRR